VPGTSSMASNTLRSRMPRSANWVRTICSPSSRKIHSEMEITFLGYPR
jgi:hypothetical protein